MDSKQRILCQQIIQNDYDVPSLFRAIFPRPLHHPYVQNNVAAMKIEICIGNMGMLGISDKMAAFSRAGVLMSHRYGIMHTHAIDWNGIQLGRSTEFVPEEPGFRVDMSTLESLAIQAAKDNASTYEVPFILQKSRGRLDPENIVVYGQTTYVGNENEQGAIQFSKL